MQKEWFTDPHRIAKAGSEPDHTFATKPQLAKTQAERALDAGLAPTWATGDEVYGRSIELREVFESRGIGYVFAVGRDFQVTASGQVKTPSSPSVSMKPRYAATGSGNGTRPSPWPPTRCWPLHRHWPEPPPEPVLPDDPDQRAPADCGMTALTVPEIQCLLTMTSAQQTPVNQNIEFHLAWSEWHRRHQARARWHHYRTRLALTA